MWKVDSGEQIVAILGIGYTDTFTSLNENAAMIIRERRTVRQFTSATLEAETVRALLEQSIPEHGLQPKSWRVIEAGTEEERRQWTDLMMGFAKDILTYKIMPGKFKKLFWKRTYDIPFNLVFVLKHQPENPDEPKNSAHFGEVCSVMQNVQLLAWEKGIWMTWSSSDVIEDTAFRKGLDIKPDERIIGILHMGYTAKLPKGKERTPADANITY
ncbi:nitroreductase family protein [Paenibacillus sp. NPDC057886]|uniref:nitroreductase family protein n=1 Tax=Paenibacillus sp. NPDC057886 TaxID=3346270 RepID=UPI0036C5A367